MSPPSDRIEISSSPVSWNDDGSDVDSDAMLQDTLQVIAEAQEARDALVNELMEADQDEEEEFYDHDHEPHGEPDSIYIEFDQEEPETIEDSDEEDYDDEDDDDDDDDDDQINITELLRAHIQSSNTDENQQGDPSNIFRARHSISLAGLRRLLYAAATGRAAEEQDQDDDDDDDDGNVWYSVSRKLKMSDHWEQITQPIKAGQELLYSGEFGHVPNRPPGSPESAFKPSRNMADLILDRKYSQRRVSKQDMHAFVPNTNGTIVASYPARVYCGQYSQDSSFFYTCTQDFKVHVYDTTVSGPQKVQRLDDGGASRTHFGSYETAQYTSLKIIKSIQGRQGNWTITDANLSPDNQWMIYSSITPFVHLVPTKQHFQDGGGTSDNDNQVMLDFGNQVGEDIGIWSLRFSGDSREIVAGGHLGDIYVYDIEARKRVLQVQGHSDDVNGVAFADSASSNVLISGSDDSFVKIWDRRSLSGGKPAGVLTGHTEGITFVSPKGDGRYCISNGKDQSLKLWDLRMMHSCTTFESMSKKNYGLRNWDYRSMNYRIPRYQNHPQDCSVMTFRGHAVLKTLIRCHFSPIQTTGQKYIYSGSADGRIHIWSLDGKVVQILDRNQVRSFQDSNDPSAPLTTNSSFTHQHQQQHYVTVRDVSWNPCEPSIMSTAWEGLQGHAGSIAKHELASFNKRGLDLQDAIETDRLESLG